MIHAASFFDRSHKRSLNRQLLIVTMVMLVSSCSAVPYFPGRSFEPSPSPGPRVAPAASGPDIDLPGRLVTTKGQTVSVTTQLWFDEPKNSTSMSRVRPAGWTNVRIPMHGTLTVTNTGDPANQSATTVFYELNAAYPSKSLVCRRLVPAGDKSMVAGGYCWTLISTATPFSYAAGPPESLAPGQSELVKIGGQGRRVGVAVDAPSDESADVTDELRHPSVVAVTTNDIRGLGPRVRFRDTCPGAIIGPTDNDKEQHVLVTSTSPLTCRELPQLGFGY